MCRISCNAGVVQTDQIGDLEGYPAPVWYQTNLIDNILSLYWASRHFQVQCNSNDGDPVFRETKPDRTVCEFRASIEGLNYCDTRSHGTALVNTVESPMAKYTSRECKQAAAARRLQDIIGRPLTRDYVKIVEGGMIRNCTITKADIISAEDIFGQILGN